jgi:hypothetical protein
MAKEQQAADQAAADAAATGGSKSHLPLSDDCSRANVSFQMLPLSPALMPL